jgi:hypothetical protein
MDRIILTKNVYDDDPQRRTLERVRDFFRENRSAADAWNGGLRITTGTPYGGKRAYCVELSPARVYKTTNTTAAQYGELYSDLERVLAACGDKVEDWRVKRVEYSISWAESNTARQAALVRAMERAAASSYAAVDVIRRSPATMEMSYTVYKGLITQTCKQLSIKPTYTFWASEGMEHYFLQQAGELLMAGGLCPGGDLNCLENRRCDGMNTWDLFGAITGITWPNRRTW